jgi:hypothetical protein
MAKLSLQRRAAAVQGGGACGAAESECVMAALGCADAKRSAGNLKRRHVIVSPRPSLFISVAFYSSTPPPSPWLASAVTDARHCIEGNRARASRSMQGAAATADVLPGKLLRAAPVQPCRCTVAGACAAPLCRGSDFPLCCLKIKCAHRLLNH